jgi:voltage-gated potassium channel Kch
MEVSTERHDLREADVIVFGLGRYGSRLALGLKEAELKVLGVEFDPEVARVMRRQGLPVRYGDGIAGEFLESLPLKDTRWVVSTLPDLASNRDLLRGLRELNFTGEVAIVAREEFDGAALKKLGAPTILYPMRNAVDYAVETLTAVIRPQEEKP